MKVIAAMSGGVDSAVAAARAVDAGHDVTGIHLALSRNPQSYRSGARGCCTIEDANDARRAADLIGIPFYVWDLSERFHEDVVEDFIERVRCRPHPQPLPALQREDQVRGRARPRAGARVRRGGDRALRDARRRRRRDRRDAPCRGRRQGPVLRPRRAHPGAAGALAVPARRHPQGRACAARRDARGLLVAQKPDSHDICFIADGDTAGWLREKLGRVDRRDRRPRVGRGARLPRRLVRLHDRPAPWPAHRHVLPPTGSRATCSTSSRSRARSRSGRGRRSPSTGSTASSRAGAAPRPSWSDGTVQLRAHGAEHRADGEGRRRPRGDRAARPGPGDRARARRPSSTTAPASVGSCTIAATSERGRPVTLGHRRRVAPRARRPARLRRGA